MTNEPHILEHYGNFLLLYINAIALMIDGHQMPPRGVPHTRRLDICIIIEMNVTHNRRLVHLNFGAADAKYLYCFIGESHSCFCLTSSNWDRQIWAEEEKKIPHPLISHAPNSHYLIWPAAEKNYVFLWYILSHLKFYWQPPIEAAGQDKIFTLRCILNLHGSYVNF